MAHLPRWVETPMLDSTAMLSAFLEFKTSNPAVYESLGIDGHLTIIDHNSASIRRNDGMMEVDVYFAPPVEARMAAEAVHVDGLRNVTCPEPGCQRCVTGRWGYTFRWYSPLWSETYEKIARPGSWKPGQSETEFPSISTWDHKKPSTWHPNAALRGFPMDSHGNIKQGWEHWR